jgi:serine/threonine protein kinase
MQFMRFMHFRALYYIFLSLFIQQYLTEHFYDEAYTVNLLKELVTNLNMDPRQIYTFIPGEALGSGLFSKVYLAYATLLGPPADSRYAVPPSGSQRVGHHPWYAIKMIKITNLKTLGYIINELSMHSNMSARLRKDPFLITDIIPASPDAITTCMDHATSADDFSQIADTTSWPSSIYSAGPLITSELIESYYFDAYVYLVYPYIHGVTLSQLLSATKAPEIAAMSGTPMSAAPLTRHALALTPDSHFYLMMQLLAFRHFFYTPSLHYLCHQDWDPSNCMVNQDGQLIMMDFGLSAYHLAIPHSATKGHFSLKKTAGSQDIRRRFMYTSHCTDPAKIIRLLSLLAAALAPTSQQCLDKHVLSLVSPDVLTTQPDAIPRLQRALFDCYQAFKASEEQEDSIASRVGNRKREASLSMKDLWHIPHPFPTSIQLYNSTMDATVPLPDFIAKVHPNLPIFSRRPFAATLPVGSPRQRLPTATTLCPPTVTVFMTETITITTV